MPPAAMTGTGATASTTAGSGVDSEVSRGGGVAIPVGPSLGRLGESRRLVARAREAERCRIPSHDSVGALGGAETRRPAAGRRTDAVARGRSKGLPTKVRCGEPVAGVVIAAKAFRPTRGQDFRIRKTATRDPAGCKVRGIASRPTTEGNGATRRAREAVPTPPRTFTCCGCGGDLNYNGHCNPEIDALIDQQSTETNQEKRKRLVSGAGCRSPPASVAVKR